MKKNWRMKENGHLKIFLFLFVIGNLFFLNSNRLFRGTTTMVELTPYSSEIAWNDRVFELERWEYDEKRQLMEIELSIIENRSLDGIYRYEYQSREYNEGELEVEAVVETEEMLILRVKDVPKRYTVLSLHLNVPHGDPEEDLILYENDETISQTALVDRTVTEYVVEKLERQVRELTTAVALSNQQIDAEQEKIINGQERIEQLTNKIAFQAGDTKERTQSQIDDINSMIGTCQETIAEEEEKIAIYNLEKESLESLIRQYKEQGEEENG